MIGSEATKATRAPRSPELRWYDASWSTALPDAVVPGASGSEAAGFPVERVKLAPEEWDVITAAKGSLGMGGGGFLTVFGQHRDGRWTAGGWHHMDKLISIYTVRYL